RGQSNRPWRADDNLCEFLALYIIQHLKDRWETQFLQLVFGQLKFSNGREVFDRDVANSQITPGSYDDEFLPAGCAGRGHFPDCRGYAVHVFERVREPAAFAVLQGNRNFAGQFFKNSSQPFSRGRLAVKTVDVRRENY